MKKSPTWMAVCWFDKLFIHFILCVWVFWRHVCLGTTYVQCPKSSKECIRFTGTGVTYHCNLTHVFWEFNPDLLEEQQMFLILSHLFSLFLKQTYNDNSQTSKKQKGQVLLEGVRKTYSVRPAYFITKIRQRLNK